MISKDNLQLALLISGNGSTAESVIKAVNNKILKKITPVIVISSNPQAPGIKKALNLGVKTSVINPANFKDKKEFGENLLEILKNSKIDLVSQNGWMPLTPENVIRTYQRRIINQHPGPLDPGRKLDFGGKGIYGQRVNCARIAYCWLVGRDFWTEATTHFVTELYDQGDLIRTEKLAIPKKNYKRRVSELKKDFKSLIMETQKVQNSLFPIEHQNVIETLKLFAVKGLDGVIGCRRSKPLVPFKDEEILDKAKELAIELFPEG